MSIILVPWNTFYFAIIPKKKKKKKKSSTQSEVAFPPLFIKDQTQLLVPIYNKTLVALSNIYIIFFLSIYMFFLFFSFKSKHTCITPVMRGTSQQIGFDHSIFSGGFCAKIITPRLYATPIPNLAIKVRLSLVWKF